MIKSLRNILSISALLLLSMNAIAQNDAETIRIEKDGENQRAIFKNWYVGVNAGGTVMLATLRNQPFSWAVGSTFGRQLNRRFGLQANYLLGRLHAAGVYQGLDLSNTVRFSDLSLQLKINLNDLIFSKSPQLLREIYLNGGAGLTFYNSKVINNLDGTFVIGEGWDAGGIAKTGNIKAPFIPIGLGVSFYINKSKRYFLTSEVAYRFSSDNKLDGGLSTPSHPTHYMYASVGFVYPLGKQTHSVQEIASEVMEKKVQTSVLKIVKEEMVSSIQEEIKPMKIELANQSKVLSENTRKIAAIKADVEMRINALQESAGYGSGLIQTSNGTVSNSGGVQVARGAGVPSLSSVYFAFNSIFITADMEREIAVLAKMMRKNRKLNCEITGNSSRVGSPDYNYRLSERRAQAVAKFLVNEFGIDSDRIVVRSNGLDDPLAKNLHKINRRVDMQLFW